MSAQRYVCHFSCGAASAVAAKLTIHQRIGLLAQGRVLIVNAFIQEEHPDNRRFLADCEQWLGVPVKVLRDECCGASTDEVWRRKRYMKGPHGAPCSKILKRDLLDSISRRSDINVIGYTAEEEDRAIDLQQFAPDKHWHFPLIERGLSKEDCKAMIKRAGIELPLMYRLGYDNANCIGCPKGGQAYWQNIREDFPERFVQIKAIQENIGPGSYFLRFRSGPRKNERMPLAELPPGRGDMAQEPSFSCSFFCDLAEREYSS